MADKSRSSDLRVYLVAPCVGFGVVGAAWAVFTVLAWAFGGLAKLSALALTPGWLMLIVVVLVAIRQRSIFWVLLALGTIAILGGLFWTGGAAFGFGSWLTSLPFTSVFGAIGFLAICEFTAFKLTQAEGETTSQSVPT